MIINLGCASVDNHIPRDDIFDYHPLRECNIYIVYMLLYHSQMGCHVIINILLFYQMFFLKGMLSFSLFFLNSHLHTVS